MASSSSPAHSTKSAAPIPLKRLCSALGNSIRWQLLAELATGEPLRIAQLAKGLGLKPDSASKHLQALRTAGLAEFGANRLYSLPERFTPESGKWEIDVGHCVVRLPEPKVGKRRNR